MPPPCLFDVNPAKFGVNDNLVTQASHFGDQREVFNGVDIGINAKFGTGFLSGGVSTGRTGTDNCYQNNRPDFLAAGSVAANPGSAAFCHVSPPRISRTQVKFNGARRPDRRTKT